jgi:predicted O-methyltransferase YrrM
MNQLTTIDDKFVDDYIFSHRNNLGKPSMGGTDWRFADIVAPSFKEILEISNPKSVLEIGFNAGCSALMFLSINPELVYDSVDIEENEKSIEYLSNRFKDFMFTQINSRLIDPVMFCFMSKYDLVFIDGDHSRDGVISDIEVSLKFNPEYVLFDDWRHPSHDIEKIATEDYADKLEIVKVFEFNQCWQGYSMALCKVKYD